MKPTSTERPVRVGLISLGCAKNLVDGEIMLGSLLKDGVEIINDAAQADVMIVNTCSFIDAAQEESVDAILESAEVREAKNRGQGLVVSGCLPQRFRDELPKLLPEVDAFMGIDQVAAAGRIVREAAEKRRAKLQTANVKLQRRREEPGVRSRDGGRRKEQNESGPKQEPASKAAVMDRLGELDKTAGLEHSHQAPSGPLVEVNLRPNYI